MPDLLLAAVAIFLGSVLSGFAGFGLSAVAGAILVHRMDPLHAVPLMMLCSVVTQIAGLVHLRVVFRPASALPFCAGGIAGLAIGLPILGAIDERAYRALFGCVLIVYALAAAGRTRPVSGMGNGAERLLVGAMGGIVGALTALPSTALVIWADLRGHPKAALRGVVQPYVTAMQVAALMGMAGAGMLDPVVLAPLVVACMPGLAAGCALGLWLYGRAGAALWRSAILWTLAGSGAALLAA